MKEFVTDFEKHLQERLEHDSSEEKNKIKEMILLYQDIRNELTSVYGYADLESVFSVVETLSRNIQYADLGFQATYLISKIKENLPKTRIINESEQ